MEKEIPATVEFTMVNKCRNSLNSLREQYEPGSTLPTANPYYI